MAFPGDYTKYQNVTIDKDLVDATLTDFPVFIDLSDLDTTTDIFDTCRSDGGDIRVTLSNGTTQLAREIVSIDTTAKTGEMHVKIPSLSSSVDTVIRVWYNGTDTEPAEDSTYGKENTWNSNYLMVQHMGQDPSGTAPQVIDSTANDRDCTSTGSMTSGDVVAGQIGDCLDFDGIDDYIEDADAENYLDGLTSISVQCWLQSTSSGTDRGFITGNTVNTSDQGLSLRYDAAGYEGGESNVIKVAFGNITGNDAHNSRIESSASLQTMSWQKIDTTWIKNSAPNLYIDGALDTPSFSYASDTALGNLNALRIGFHSREEWSGKIDEVRILDSVLSADWISTEYNNQSSPSTFYSVSGEQAAEATFKPFWASQATRISL